MRSSKRVYLNPKQKRFVESPQKTRLFLGGRGSGKSFVLGVVQRIKAGEMPRSKGALVSTTYNQILTKTLPAIISAWEALGIFEDVHYVIGKKPPRHFEKPYDPPKKFQNVISWRNGRTVEMISMDRPDLARGGSYDDVDWDEAALSKHSDWTRIILPSIRGNTHRFRTHWHQMAGFYTSLPWEPSGAWVLNFEEKAIEYPDEYVVVEASAYDNIHILTEKGINRMKEEMGTIEFEVEVLNKRMIKVEGAFYHAFAIEKHTYTPRYIYKEDEIGTTIDGVKEYSPNSLIDVSFDFSGWFNCMTVFQGQGYLERMINSFHVKEDEKIDTLIKNFCETYKDHQFKLVHIYGEPRGHDRQALTPSIYETIVSILHRQGWQAEVKAHSGRTKLHLERYQFVNDILQEEIPTLPKLRINKETCKSVIIAIQTTQIDKNFRKDKSKEKNRDFPQEHAPHYTDTVDYFLAQKHGWRLSGQANALPGQAIFI